MQFLLDIPLVMSLATWIWGEDPDVTPETCVELSPLMSGPCWSRLITKALGVAIILGACVNRVPIINNILKTKSTEGLSRVAIYGEGIMYTNSVFYGLFKAHPLTAFGENIALLIQNVIIMLMTWTFAASPVSFIEKSVVVISTFAYLASVNLFLTEDSYYILMASIWPILIFAKGSQILATYRVKHTGSQSIVTFGMNVLGSSIRVMTTLKEIGLDPALFSVLLSVVLNSIPFVQYFYYRKNTEDFIRRMEAKKSE